MGVIECLGGLRIEASEVRQLCFEHVLCDAEFDWMPRACRPRVDASEVLPRLAGGVRDVHEAQAMLRLDPRLVRANLRLDSPELAARELSSLGPRTVIGDVTTLDEGRSEAGLRRVAALLGPEQGLIYGASVRKADATSADAVASVLRREISIATDGFRPPFITVCFGPDDATDVLEGARLASHGKVLVVVGLPALGSEAALKALVARTVDALGPETPLVLRCQARCRPAVLLQGHAGLALIDGWGRPLETAAWTRPVGETNAKGDDISDDISDDDARLRLLALSPPDRCLIATGVRHQSQLAARGGLGYAYAGALVRGSDPSSSYSRLLAANPTAITLLVAKETAAPVRIDEPTVLCSLCGTPFPASESDQFSKYDFVYCSRACLDAHRRAKFETSRMAGPSASAQRHY